MSGTFLYFAYGSNLLAQRIHLANPSAQFISSACLDNYRLTFGNISKQWGGATATIVPESGSKVWGVLWSLSMEHLPTLDHQECTPHVYTRIRVPVTTPNSETHEVWTYQLVKGTDLSPIPSAIYHRIIVRGAVEHGLPEDYVEFLRSIETNSFEGNDSTPLKI